MKDILEFISNNQTLIITVVLCATFLINKLVNRMASNPKEDVWDKIKPYSNAACSLVFDGVEYLAKSKKMTSAMKSMEYANVLQKFADNWGSNKATALAELYAWYESNKKKSPDSEQITQDSVAVE